MTELELEQLEERCNKAKSIVSNMNVIKRMLSNQETGFIFPQVPVTYNGQTITIKKERFLDLLEKALADCKEQLDKL